MDPFHHFKLEASVLAALAILIARVGPQLSNVSRSVRWIHFGLVGIFSLLGIAGRLDAGCFRLFRVTLLPLQV